LVLADPRLRLVTALRLQGGPYHQALAVHFDRHLKPFLENYS
jgi:hypothetical protein